jgi:hypothetical protein
VLPVVAYGKEDEGAEVEARRARSNVQDWWPAFAQFSAARVRAIAVYPPDGNETGRRYVYAVEWPNPQPDKELRAIRLISDPVKEDCLLILGITTLQ